MILDRDTCDTFLAKCKVLTSNAHLYLMWLCSDNDDEVELLSKYIFEKLW